ncbi:efflux RND transporter periplasmic adaptor subunit [Tepidicaulis sp. LMO-SS28]|uniref:efflux RND transporter periplasmic adaptor subunit n=1 Tax=Tepidicaulis sp. LMO-SS28 TaxID=3447455 RepID=UPI003EE16FC2
MPAPQVEAARVTAEDVPLQREYPGRIAGYRSVEVRARVEGILLSREYEEGSIVDEGDVLFLIDPAPYEAALSGAKARLEQEESNLRRAEKTWERIRELFSHGNVSAQRRDDALAELEAARSKVSDAKAQVDTAELDLGYTTVRAPITGATSMEVLSEGSLVQNRSLLTTMTQLDPVYVNFSFTSKEATRFRYQVAAGEIKTSPDGKYRIRLHFDNGMQYAAEGLLDFTDNTADAATGTIRARAVVPNPDKILVPGQFTSLVLSGLSLPNAIAVPKRALMQAADGAYVYVLDDQNIAARRLVVLGEELEDRWVISEGLKEGERIVVEGVVKVRPGGPVSVEEGKAGAAGMAAEESAMREAD